MRIAHYLHAIRLEYGGVVRAVLDMTRHLAEAGQDVTLITSDDRDAPDSWKRGEPGTPRIARIPWPRRHGLWDGAFERAVRPLVRACDVLHLHVLWDPTQLAFLKAAREFGTPYVQSPHGMLADWSVKQSRLRKVVYYRLFARRLLDGASFVVTTAQGELDQSQKRHPKTPGVAIPLILDLEPYRTLPGPGPARASLPLPGPEKPSLLYLSRLHYKKRPDRLIRAARPLRDMGLDFNVIIAGPAGDDGYDAELRALARELKVDDITRFLGMVPAEYKTSLFQACDLFVLPTHMENFGFVYYESLACATPLVTTKGTDTWRELQESGGGRIVEPIEDDLSELVRTLAELIRDRQRLRAMGESGRRWILENMEPSYLAGRYVDMYQRAIDSCPGAARAATPAVPRVS